MYKLLFFLAWAYTSTAFAQKNSFKQTISDACDCFGHTQLDGRPLAGLEQAVDSCVEYALLLNLSTLLADKLFDIDQQDQVQQFAERLGQQLYAECEPYRRYWNLRAQEELAIKQAKTPSVVGKIERIDRSLDGARQIFWLRLPTMQLLPFYWLREFDGSTRFFGPTSPHVGKRVRIFWEEVTLFDPLRQRYEPFREIKMLEELEQAVPNPDLPKKWQRLKRRQARKYKKFVRKLRIRQVKAQLRAVRREK